MTILCVCVFFFLKQKTAYEMRISDWSSDVCSSDLRKVTVAIQSLLCVSVSVCTVRVKRTFATRSLMKAILRTRAWTTAPLPQTTCGLAALFELKNLPQRCCRSEEHTSELQSLMRISYAVFCLKNKIQKLKLMNTPRQLKRNTYTPRT